MDSSQKHEQKKSRHKRLYMILFSILEKTVLVYNGRKQIIGFLGAIVVIKEEGTQRNFLW